MASQGIGSGLGGGLSGGLGGLGGELTGFQQSQGGALVLTSPSSSLGFDSKPLTPSAIPLQSYGRSTLDVVTLQQRMVNADPSATSRTHLGGAIADGVLSSEREQGLHKEVVAMVSAAAKEVMLSAGLMRAAIADFSAKAGRINDGIAKYVEGLLEKASSGELKQEDLGSVMPLLQTAELAHKLFGGTADRVLDLSERASRTNNTAFGELVMQIFNIRQRQLDLYEKEVGIIHQNEAHQVNLECKRLEASLEANNQFFDQMKDVMVHEQKAKEAEAAQAAKSREIELGHIAKMEDLRLGVEKTRIIEEGKRYATQLTAQVEQFKADRSAAAAMHGASTKANADVRMTEIKNSGGCVAM